LAIGAAAAALTALLSWPLAQNAALQSLDRELAVLKPNAETALRAEVTARRADERNAAILALRGGRPPLAGVLDALSRDLPDGAWLLSLSVTGSEVVLDGLASSAAATALSLEKGHNVGDIVFRSPISRDASGFEHFQLGARLSMAKP
jgi:Tfp pilus assembly protein PilN